MSEKPKVSVIIPSFNRADAIGLTLDYLALQSLPADQFEVLAVDDGSTDETAHIIASQRQPFLLTHLEQRNLGAAAARNLGIKHARASVLVFLDADVVPDAEFLREHLNAHTGSVGHLVVGRVQTWPDAKRQWCDTVIDPDNVGMDYGEREQVVPFYMALAGNLSATKQVLETIGGFDETFPAAGCEETELAYRASLLGYQLLYQPRAVGYHNHPRTLQQRCQQQSAHMKSMALLIGKHPELQSMIPGVDEMMPLWSRLVSARSLWRRSRAFLLGALPSRFLLYQALSFLSQHQMFPRFSSILFWRLMTGYSHAGFLEGMRSYWGLSTSPVDSWRNSL